MFLHKNTAIFSLLPTLYYKQVTVITTLTFTYQEIDPFASSVILNINDDLSLSANNKTFIDNGFCNVSGMSATGTDTPAGSIQTRYSPFCPVGWSGYFAGNNTTYLSITHNNSFILGNSNFTLEAWVYPTVINVDNEIIWMNCDGGNGGLGLRILSNNKLIAYMYDTTSLLSQIDGLSTIKAYTWNHVAVVRNGTTIRTYLNGKLDGSVDYGTRSIRTGTNHVIGTSPSTSNTYFNGYINNLRCIKDTALYTSTSDFTPPSGQGLSAASGTILLTLQDRDLKDNSPLNLTLNKTDAFRIREFNSPATKFVEYNELIHGGSVYITSNSIYLGYVTIPYDKDAHPFNKKSTIEFWFNLDKDSTAILNKKTACLLSQNVSSNSTSWGIFLDGDAGSTGTSIQFKYSSDVILTYTLNPVQLKNTWNHIAVTNDGFNGFTMFFNGTNVNSNTYSSPITGFSNNLSLGRQNVTSLNYYYNGYISNLRIVNGQNVYTTNFTPPTGLVTETSNGGALVGSTIVPDLSVTPTLLMDFTNAGIVDKTYYNVVFDQGFAKTQTITTNSDASLNFNGSSSRLSIPNKYNIFDFLTNDYTIEFWYYTRNIKVYVSPVPNGGSKILDFRASSTDSGQVAVGGPYYPTLWQCNFKGDTPFEMLFGSTLKAQFNCGNPALNTWTHIVFNRINGKMYTFRNGVLIGNGGTHAHSILARSYIKIGATVNGTNGNTIEALDGNLRDFRITKGVGRYTTSFTPPTKLAYDQTDPYWYNVILFLDGDQIGNPVNNVYRASVADINAGASLISNNAVTQSSLFSPPVSPSISSGCFDGSSYLTISNKNTPSNFPPLILGFDNFTIECWIYVTKIGVTNKIFALNNTGLGLEVASNNRLFLVATTVNNTNFSGAGTTNILENTWYHVAVVRNRDNITAYLDGVQQISIGGVALQSILAGTSNVIGSNSIFSEFFNGFIADFRYVKGRALYTSNFTRPTSPLPDINGTVISLKFDNSKILDTTGNNIIATAGNTRTDVLSTASLSASKGSLYFDGNNSYLKLPITNNQQLSSGNFTVEFWINRIGNNTTQSIMDYRIDATSQLRPYIYINSSNQITFNVSNTDLITSNLNLTGWSHVAIVKNSSSTVMFVNGISASTVYTDNNTYLNPTKGIFIGAANNLTNYFNGYIDDLRVTKEARYTENFTTFYKNF